MARRVYGIALSVVVLTLCAVGGARARDGAAFFDQTGKAGVSDEIYRLGALSRTRPTARTVGRERIRVDVVALEQKLAREHPEIPRAAVHKAFQFYLVGGARNLNYVTIIDYGRPSYDRRMSVIDMRTGKTEAYLVAHGSGSGDDGPYAERFSNDVGSHASSLGLYLTRGEYVGEHGRSLRLKGLEPTNDNVTGVDKKGRDIVLHDAPYVADGNQAWRNGRWVRMLGTSDGCPAVERRFRDRIIDEIRGGSILLMYHPHPRFFRKGR